MRSLVLCPSCHRHVESDETACPFCQAALVPSPDPRACHGPCSGHTSPRLGRLAMIAAGATLLCAACGRSYVVEYGPAMLLDAGHQKVDAGGQTDSAIDAVPDAKK